ncbi:MAG: hypothetical protein EON60_11280 [Alphaproteobacteria bacterium]|nr:MAG: hypothetical protein EON60_11280 [Alphaproteobacteria bacterium]
MTLPATPVMVMVLTLTRGQPHADAAQPTHAKSWIANRDVHGRFSLWKTEVLQDERHEAAAARCINQNFGLSEKYLHQDTDMIACGDALTGTCLLRLFYLPWLMPHDMLRSVNAAYLNIEGPDSWNTMLDDDTSLLLAHAKPGLKRQLDMVERPALHQLYN